MRALPILLTAFLFVAPAQAKYGGSSGEPSNPYLIYTTAQMNAIGVEPNDWDKNFRLMEYIDLAGYTGQRLPLFNIIG